MSVVDKKATIEGVEANANHLRRYVEDNESEITMRSLAVIVLFLLEEWRRVK